MMKQTWAVAVLFVMLVNMVRAQEISGSRMSNVRNKSQSQHLEGTPEQHIPEEVVEDPAVCVAFDPIEDCGKSVVIETCPNLCNIEQHIPEEVVEDPPVCAAFDAFEDCKKSVAIETCPNLCNIGSRIPIVSEMPQSQPQFPKDDTVTTTGNELIAAVIKQDAGIVRELIRKGADVNYTQFVDGYFNGWTPIMYASQALSTPILKALIDAGADVNAKTLSDASSALHLAAQQPGNHTIIPLLEAGADPSLVNDYSQTALHFAAQQEDAVALNAILDYDFSTVNKTDEQGYAPIHYAAQLINPEGLQYLIDVWANVELKTAHGNTPLHLAARKAGGVADSVKALIEVGAVLDEQDAHGGSALHYAAEQESAEIARALLEAGAQWNKKNAIGQTPLHRAVEYGRNEIINLLATSCAAVSVKDVNGQTPIFYARHRDDAGLAQILRSKCKKTRKIKAPN